MVVGNCFSSEILHLNIPFCDHSFYLRSLSHFSLHIEVLWPFYFLPVNQPPPISMILIQSTALTSSTFYWMFSVLMPAFHYVPGSRSKPLSPFSVSCSRCWTVMEKHLITTRTQWLQTFMANKLSLSITLCGNVSWTVPFSKESISNLLWSPCQPLSRYPKYYFKKDIRNH